ncbi:hypothetical protein TNCV_4376031 [Trichonephila clavipes]|nr:hypothetical protein TNCV_4376031 [Trichonephila clavipes]
MYGGYFSAGSHLSSVPTDLMDRIDTTRDFKYPHNQKSTGVKSGDQGGQRVLRQRLSNHSLFPERLYQNALIVSSGTGCSIPMNVTFETPTLATQTWHDSPRKKR